MSIEPPADNGLGEIMSSEKENGKEEKQELVKGLSDPFDGIKSKEAVTYFDDTKVDNEKKNDGTVTVKPGRIWDMSTMAQGPALAKSFSLAELEKMADGYKSHIAQLNARLSEVENAISRVKRPH
jgi:hypothetical protein